MAVFRPDYPQAVSRQFDIPKCHLLIKLPQPYAPHASFGRAAIGTPALMPEPYGVKLAFVPVCPLQNQQAVFDSG